MQSHIAAISVISRQREFKVLIVVVSNQHRVDRHKCRVVVGIAHHAKNKTRITDRVIVLGLEEKSESAQRTHFGSNGW